MWLSKLEAISTEAVAFTAESHPLAQKMVLSPAEILELGSLGEKLVGGKNYNMAKLNCIPGVRGAPFRAISATAYRFFIENTYVAADGLDRLIDATLAQTDFAQLAHEHGNEFQPEFVLKKGWEFRNFNHSQGNMNLKDYIQHHVEKAKAQLLQTSQEDRLDVLRNLSMRIQIAVLSVELPVVLQAEIEKSYAEINAELNLENVAVAVRSSAVGEDSVEAAFAGAQDTYLNISGAGEVVLHVQRDFASGFNVRALEYRLSQIDKLVNEQNISLSQALDKFDFNHIAVSVVIQKMIQSQKAGTAFSVDPSSGMPEVISIDANWGYGESVVGGKVTPDNYLVTRNQKLIVKNMGEKSEMVIKRPGNGTEMVATPPEQIFQWVLSHAEILALSAQVWAVQKKYGMYVDTEFAIDETGIYLIQARPETEYNQQQRQKPGVISLKRKEVAGKDADNANTLVKGNGASQGAATGTVRFISNIHDKAQLGRFKDGDILVAERTDPDFLSLFKRAGAVIANVGGRTSHAAITSRELRIPAVIGVGNLEALKKLDGLGVTVDGSRGAVYSGELDLVTAGEDIDTLEIEAKYPTQTGVGLILADIQQAKFLNALRNIPDFKVGLLRAEFVLGSIGVHYKALKAFDLKLYEKLISLTENPLKLEQLQSEIKTRLNQSGGLTLEEELVAEILSGYDSENKANTKVLREKLIQIQFEISERLTKSGYSSARDFYIETLSQNIALFAYAFEGKDVIYRTTDYKSNEYEGLLGGTLFETAEDNPMLGYRGVARGIDPWEIEAFQKARETYGAINLHIMFPFVRNERELVQTIGEVSAHGLERGSEGLKFFVMAEIPSVAMQPQRFLRHVDGFSIGSNDLTQGILMTDRDSERLQETYDEEDPAVIQGILAIIFAANQAGKEVGFCGMGVSNSELIAALVSIAGIDSASVTPDAYVRVKKRMHHLEGQGLTVSGLPQWIAEYKKRQLREFMIQSNLKIDDKFLENEAQFLQVLQDRFRDLTALVYAGNSSEVLKAKEYLRELNQLIRLATQAFTDYSAVLQNALQAAGFSSAGEYDRFLKETRSHLPH